MKKLFLIYFVIALLLMQSVFLQSQSIYLVKDGRIEGVSETTLATIKTSNSHITGALDLRKGTVEITLPTSEFQFKSRLMKEHFEDWFIHAGQFPSAVFSGQMDLSQLDF